MKLALPFVLVLYGNKGCSNHDQYDNKYRQKQYNSPPFYTLTTGAFGYRLNKIGHYAGLRENKKILIYGKAGIGKYLQNDISVIFLYYIKLCFVLYFYWKD